MVGLKKFVNTLRMPQIDIYPISIDCEICAFLVLMLNLYMWENFIDEEFPCPLGYEFSCK